MAYSFSDDDKAATDYQERLPFGVSEVKLVGVTAGETEAGKDFVEVTVANDAGVEDSARVWFVGGASPYSFQTLRQIVVHTASEADKEKARMAVEKTKDNDELAALMNKQCIGKQLWFSKYYSRDRTYTTSDGDIRSSIDSSVYGYEPKLKPELMPETTASEPTTTTTGDAPIDLNGPNAPKDPLAGAKPATGEAADNIPSDWS